MVGRWVVNQTVALCEFVGSANVEYIRNWYAMILSERKKCCFTDDVHKMYFYSIFTRKKFYDLIAQMTHCKELHRWLLSSIKLFSVRLSMRKNARRIPFTIRIHIHIRVRNSRKIEKNLWTIENSVDHWSSIAGYWLSFSSLFTVQMENVEKKMYKLLYLNLHKIYANIFKHQLLIATQMLLKTYLVFFGMFRCELVRLEYENEYTIVIP